MQTTWRPSASARSCSPTARAVWPPMPASTSSKTSVAEEPSLATPSRASMTRDSSPPDAVSRRAAAGTPGLGAMRNSTASAPVGPTGVLALAQLDRERRALHRQLGQPLAHGVGQLRRGPRRAPARSAAPSGQVGPRGLQLRRRGLERGRRRPPAPRAAPGSARRARGPPRSSRRACAPAGAGRPGVPRRRPASLALRLGVEPLGVAAQLAREVVGLQRDGAPALGEPVERRVDARLRVERGPARGQQRYGARALVGRGRLRGAQRPPRAAPRGAAAARARPSGARARPGRARPPRSPRSSNSSRSSSRSRAPAVARSSSSAPSSSRTRADRRARTPPAARRARRRRSRRAGRAARRPASAGGARAGRRRRAAARRPAAGRPRAPSGR